MKLTPARADGRPQYYDIHNGERVECFICLLNGIVARYGVGRAVMCDPANPPEGGVPGGVYTICVRHIPEDAVIYNPRTNFCRNKAGDHTWEEAPRQEIPGDDEGLAP